MQGADIRELWARIIKLEKKVAALEIEDDNYEILGTFAVPNHDSISSDVKCDTSVEERTIDDYEDNGREAGI